MPEKIPEITDQLSSLRSKSYVELCETIVGMYAPDLRPEVLRDLIRTAYASFEDTEIVRLLNAGNLYVLELFLGPTLAFKDIALQLLGNLFEHVLGQRSEGLNILGATSGDTGSAAIAAVKGRSNIRIFILYPDGRVSPLQELQMTSAVDDNVHCLAIEGSFDDCQSIMKDIFNDTEFKSTHKLGAVNSVNWARVMIQVVYYIYAALKFDEPVTFSVPTGNFGNILAGVIAQRMGAPIKNLVLATNENDILARYFTSGVYKRGEVHQTSSPSMDIQVASNFERFVYLQLNKDGDAVSRFMEEFANSGEAELALDATGDQKIYATMVSETAASETMRKYGKEYDQLLEPHTAIGVRAAEMFDLAGPNICLATAHPAKFPQALESALGTSVTHERLERLKELPSRKVQLPASLGKVKDYIHANALSVA